MYSVYNVLYYGMERKETTMNTITFTVYFPNKEKFEYWLEMMGISYTHSTQAFMEWYKVAPKYKETVKNYILKEELQEGMADEYRWLGWTDWMAGYNDREELGMKHY